jgi:predicted lipoprotein with Yx(FWY)xxD motif
MRRPIGIAVVLGSVVLAVAGCGGSDKKTSSQKNRSAATPATGTSDQSRRAARTRSAKRTVAKTTTVKVMTTRYGRILVDGQGRALYLFTRESTPTVRCYGACATAWPVFHARGNLRAGTGADRHLIGTISRRDGTKQVTYAGHPLYYYVTDRKPGQVTCQNVDEYGGTWLVVAPGGTAIRRS